MKKLLSLAVTIVMVFAFGASAFAEAGTFALGSAIRTSSLVISGTTATCTSTYKDDSGSTTKIVITQTLEKDGFLWTWETIGGTRTKTVNGSTATLTGKVSNLESGTYRVKTVFEVTADGETETITVYSAEKEI
ncbi:MAG: hypothetical protein IJZ47_01090 [Oscillospiraceae bacterium]|nr:hypothetical protein [Oscillospiraceae bacterium]